MSKTLDRISALLAQAEGSDNEHEADAYLKMAQSLATNAALDLEVARQHQRDKTKREQPIQKQIQVAQYIGSKVQNNAAEFVELITTIGFKNDLAFDVSHKSLYVIAYGMPSDIEVTEALYASLLLQMKAACDAALATGEYKKEAGEEYWDERTWSVKVRRPDARRFRTSFYKAFTLRISTRLSEAKQQALKERENDTFEVDTYDVETGAEVTTTGSAALVLKGKEVEVKEFRDRVTSARGTYRGGRRDGVSSSGQRAGDAAGRSARISAAQGITSGRTSIK